MMSASMAFRDLSPDAASLRIERDGRTRLRTLRDRAGRWIGLVLVLVAVLAAWWWLTTSRALEVRTTTVDVQSGLSAGDRIVVDAPAGLTDEIGAQEAPDQ
jgi:hypothetical protein